MLIDDFVKTSRFLRSGTLGYFASTLLTSFLYLYPKRLRLEYAPVESSHVFPNLPLFAVLFYTWFALLMVLLSKLDASDARTQKKAFFLVGLFALGYRGVLDAIVPDFWSDGLTNLASVRFIVENGYVPRAYPNLGYLDFPGLLHLAANLSIIVGMDVRRSSLALLLVFDVLIAWLAYLVSIRLLRRPGSAGAAAVIGLLGSPVFAVFFFYPAFLGYIFTAMFAFIILSNCPVWTAQNRIVVLVLLAASTLTHFVSSIAFAFVGAGVLLSISSSGDGKLSRFHLGLLLAVPVAWLVFYTSVTFRDVALMSSRFLESLKERPFFWIVTVANANLGYDQPLWVTALRLYWLAVLYGIGSFALLGYAFRGRILDSRYRMAAGALGGLLILSGVNTLLSKGGFEFFRILIFAPLVTAPALVRLAEGARAWRFNGRNVLVGIAIGLSLPTFLVYRARLEQYAYYPAEYAAARYVAYAASGEEISVYTTATSGAPLVFEKPDISLRFEGLAGLDFKDEEQLWNSFRLLLTRFSSAGEASAFFVHSSRPKSYYRHVYRISEGDARWDWFLSQLERTNRVYGNSLVDVYQR